MAKSIANQSSPSQVRGRAATLMRLLEEEGLPYESWQLPIDDPAKRRSLVQYWQAGMPALETVATIPAQAVGYVHDTRAVNELLSLGYDEAALQAFGDHPPDALPGFLTFFDPGWSLLSLRQFCASKGKIFYGQDWYDREAFAKTKEEPRYRQIRLEAVDGSFNKNFDSQRRLLPETEEIPLVRAVTMGMVIHFLRSGRLFERYYVRCADKVSDGGRVYVGDFGAGGLDVRYYWDDRCRDFLGLSSARKS